MLLFAILQYILHDFSVQIELLKGFGPILVLTWRNSAVMMGWPCLSIQFGTRLTFTIFALKIGKSLILCAGAHCNFFFQLEHGLQTGFVLWRRLKNRFSFLASVSKFTYHTFWYFRLYLNPYLAYLFLTIAVIVVEFCYIVFESIKHLILGF